MAQYEDWQLEWLAGAVEEAASASAVDVTMFVSRTKGVGRKRKYPVEVILVRSAVYRDGWTLWGENGERRLDVLAESAYPAESDAWARLVEVVETARRG